MSIETYDKLSTPAGSGYGVADADQIEGAYVRVATLAARNALEGKIRLEDRTTCYVAETDRVYVWGGSEWTEAPEDGRTRVTLAERRRGKAAGYVVPALSTPRLGEVKRTTWFGDGNLRGFESRNVQTITAVSSERFKIPRVGDAERLGVDPTGRAVTIQPQKSAFSVPRVQNLMRGAWSKNGAMTSGFTSFGVLPKSRFTVPRISNALKAVWVEAGGAIEVDIAEAAGASSDVETRSVSAVVTGRAVPQVFLKRSDAVFVPVTCGPNGVELTSWAPGSAAIKRLGQDAAVKWRASPVGAGGTMHLVLVVGQSLAQGYTDTGISEKVPYWRDPVGERAWQFRAGDGIQRGPRPFQVVPGAGNREVVIADDQLVEMEPLRGANHAYNPTYSQTSLETTAAALIGHHLTKTDHVLGATVGTGSTAIQWFAPGQPHMQSVEKILNRADALATAMGLDLSVWFVWNQGEQDNTEGTAQAAYETAWLAIRDHIEAYVTSTLGGTFGGSIIQQTEHRPSGEVGMATLAHANLIRAGKAIGVPQFPMFPGHSGIHLHPGTYLPLGAANAYVIAETVRTGVPYVAPYVPDGNAVLTNSTTIDCTFTGGTGAYQFDTTTIPNHPDGHYGISVVDDGGSVAITDVSWLDTNTIRITLSEAVLLADSPVVRFGLHGGGVMGVAADGARVNIRDDSAWYCPATGQVISGWSFMHAVDVVAP